MSHNTELVAIIRKMVRDNRDTEFLPQMATMACNEIERLSKELDNLRIKSYPQDSYNRWK